MSCGLYYSWERNVVYWTLPSLIWGLTTFLPLINRKWRCDTDHIWTEAVSVIASFSSPPCSSFLHDSGKAPLWAAPLPCPCMRKPECRAKATAVSSVLSVCTKMYFPQSLLEIFLLKLQELLKHLCETFL